MKSKIIAQLKIQAEKEHNVDFVNFITTDTKNFITDLGYFPQLENEFKNGIKVIFVHGSGKTAFKFMTVVFPSSFIDHPDETIKEALKSLVGKKIRIYKGIFEHYYFDYEDQCFPNKVFKLKQN